MKRNRRQNDFSMATCSCTATSMPFTNADVMLNCGFSYSLDRRCTRSKPADTRCDSDAFDDQEKAVLAYAEQLTKQANADAATVQKLTEFLDDKQLVSLAAAVALANSENGAIMARWVSYRW